MHGLTAPCIALVVSAFPFSWLVDLGRQLPLLANRAMGSSFVDVGADAGAFAEEARMTGTLDSVDEGCTGVAPACRAWRAACRAAGGGGSKASAAASIASSRGGGVAALVDAFDAAGASLRIGVIGAIDATGLTGTLAALAEVEGAACAGMGAIPFDGTGIDDVRGRALEAAAAVRTGGSAGIAGAGLDGVLGAANSVGASNGEGLVSGGATRRMPSKCLAQ